MLVAITVGIGVAVAVAVGAGVGVAVPEPLESPPHFANAAESARTRTEDWMCRGAHIDGFHFLGSAHSDFMAGRAAMAALPCHPEAQRLAIRSTSVGSALSPTNFGALQNCPGASPRLSAFGRRASGLSHLRDEERYPSLSTRCNDERVRCGIVAWSA